jgi:hypothetical protein
MECHPENTRLRSKGLEASSRLVPGPATNFLRFTLWYELRKELMGKSDPPICENSSGSNARFNSVTVDQQRCSILRIYTWLWQAQPIQACEKKETSFCIKREGKLHTEPPLSEVLMRSPVQKLTKTHTEQPSNTLMMINNVCHDYLEYLSSKMQLFWVCMANAVILSMYGGDLVFSRGPRVSQ